jgi:hypothetical protein
VSEVSGGGEEMGQWMMKTKHELVGDEVVKNFK